MAVLRQIQCTMFVGRSISMLSFATIVLVVHSSSAYITPPFSKAQSTRKTDKSSSSYKTKYELSRVSRTMKKRGYLTLRHEAGTHSKSLALLYSNKEDIDSGLYSPGVKKNHDVIAAGEKLDQYLSENKLHESVELLKLHPSLSLPRDRFLSIFDAIEVTTSIPFDEESKKMLSEGIISASSAEQDVFPMLPSKNDMASMYETLRNLGHLRLFGAITSETYPAGGSKLVSPDLLEEATSLNMASLTPRPSNGFLFAGVGLAIGEGCLSLYSGVDFTALVLTTVFLFLLDKVIVNGTIVEGFTKIVAPEYSRKVIRHEAGHFLIAYLLGCPVEGCVLSAWKAMKDERFAAGVTAATSFFDKKLSEQINGKKPLTRDSIDRYSAIVMGGIAAEASQFGFADGGAGDEQALIQFLSSISPGTKNAQTWNGDGIRNQARWGALQAVLMLRHYSSSYDALVDALERGSNLGECIFAIESAAKEAGLTPLEEPLGVIIENQVTAYDLVLKWMYTPHISHLPRKTLNDVQSRTSTESENNDISNSVNNNLLDKRKTDLDSVEDSLKSYQYILEEKLKKLDRQLKEGLDSDTGTN